MQIVLNIRLLQSHRTEGSPDRPAPEFSRGMCFGDLFDEDSRESRSVLRGCLKSCTVKPQWGAIQQPRATTWEREAIFVPALKGRDTNPL